MNIKLMIDDLIVFEKDLLDILDNSKPDLAGEFYKYNGTKEYNGIVAEILKWYYGKMVYASWCATSLSYFANKLGILYKIGGKNENVWLMMNACKKANHDNFYDKQHLPTIIKRNDILFFEWDDKEMSLSSNKHVGVCYEDTTLDLIKTIGGNQSDSICIKNYKRSDIYAVYRL